MLKRREEGKREATETRQRPQVLNSRVWPPLVTGPGRVWPPLVTGPGRVWPPLVMVELRLPLKMRCQRRKERGHPRLETHNHEEGGRQELGQRRWCLKRTVLLASHQ
jgi:hypothetical protein